MNFIERNATAIILIVGCAAIWIYEVTHINRDFKTIAICAVGIIIATLIIMLSELGYAYKEEYLKEVKKDMCESNYTATGVYQAVIKHVCEKLIEKIPDVTPHELHVLYTKLEDKGVCVITPYTIKCKAECDRDVNILSCFTGYNIIYLLRAAYYLKGNEV